MTLRLGNFWFQVGGGQLLYDQGRTGRTRKGNRQSWVSGSTCGRLGGGDDGSEEDWTECSSTSRHPAPSTAPTARCCPRLSSGSGQPDISLLLLIFLLVLPLILDTYFIFALAGPHLLVAETSH